MRTILALFLVMMLAGGAAFAAAGEIPLRDAQGSGLTLVGEKVGRGSLSLQMRCSLDRLLFGDADTPNGRFTVLYTPSFHFGGDYGAPQLPVVNQLIRIPAGARFRVEVKSSDVQEYNLADYGISDPLFPRQPSAPKNGRPAPFVCERSAYVYRGFRGRQLVQLTEVGVMRHMRLAHLSIAPVEYDATANRLLVHNNLELEIVLDDVDMAATRAGDEALRSPAFDWLDAMVLTPESLHSRGRNAAQGLVVVAHPMFRNEIAPFVAWKTQKGYKVDLVFTDRFGTGENLTRGVRDHLAKLYNDPTPEMPAPSYVLFVGDHDLIPAFKGVTNVYETVHPTDLFYATVTPGDVLPDMITGRFSARNAAELVPQIEKTLAYEKYQLADPSYLDNVVLVAGWDSSWARSHGFVQLNYGKKYSFNQENGFRNVSAFYSTSPGQDGSGIMSLVNGGAGFVNYTAHGSPSAWKDPAVQIPAVLNLANRGKYTFVLANCCLTNKFDQDICFGEAWLRARNGGAIGYIGAANSSHWDEDLYWTVGAHAILKPNEASTPPLREQTGIGAFDAMFQGNGITNGALLLAGNMAVERSSSFLKKYYWEIYHLMGDPTLRTWFGQPRSMRVRLEKRIGLGAGSVTVEAPAGSMVGISHDGKLLGAGLTGSDGSVEITLREAPASGKATLVVTSARGIPVIEEIDLRN